MSKNINIKYQWNKENVQKLFSNSYDYLFKHSKKRYIGWFFIALSQFAIVAALKKGSFGLLIFTTIVLIYWYYGKKFIAKKRVLKEFDKSPFKDKYIMIEANKDGLKIDSVDSSFWRWNEIDEVVSLNDDILLHKSPNFYYIPSSAFKNFEDKNNFKKLAKGKE